MHFHTRPPPPGSNVKTLLPLPWAGGGGGPPPHNTAILATYAPWGQQIDSLAVQVCVGKVAIHL